MIFVGRLILMTETGKAEIKFRFEFDKFSDVFIYLSKNIMVLDKLKAVKLIYLADRLHLAHYGKPIIGDEYKALPYGPVPSKSLDIINILLNPDDAEFDPMGLAKLREKINIDYEKKHPEFSTTVNPDNYYLSGTELETLEEIVRTFGNKSGGELIAISHSHETWKQNERFVKIGIFPSIDYELFFEGNPEATVDAYEYMIESQENRDIDFAIND